MVTVTTQARDALLWLKQAEELQQPHLVMRLVSSREGRFQLVPSSEESGDQVVEHAGSKVLLIGEDIAGVLAGATIDCRGTSEGPQLIIARPQEATGGAPPD